MYSAVELAILAKQYLDHTGVALTTLSRHAVGNTKMFERLLEGYDCTGRSLEAASLFFDLKWPAEIPWPANMRPRGSALAAVRPRTGVLPERLTLPLPIEHQSEAVVECNEVPGLPKTGDPKSRFAGKAKHDQPSP